MTKTLAAFIVSFISITLFAQNNDVIKPDSIKKVLAATEIFTMLKVDGHLTEPEWQLAKPSPRFIQIEPYQGTDPLFETEVRVLYNRQYLYFAVICYDSLGKRAIRATDFKRDFDYLQHDVINLAFDGFNDKRNAMSFATNPYGVQRDLLAFDDLYYDVDWDGFWRVRTSRSDSGWVAEISIPWQTLRYPKLGNDTIQNWGFNMYRNRRLTNEVTAFSQYPRSFTSLRMDYAGILKDLKPPPPKTNIRFQPYVLSSYDHYKGFDSSKVTSETNYKFGGDLKWAINPNAVLDLTTNTDFAQADADRQVNNVTRFSVFFPERRQFFLENASLFGVGVSQSTDASGGSMRIQPFFSRRIGLDDEGNPIPIDVGGRFVYRSSKQNYGVMAMRQRGNDITPATNFFVGRFSKNFGKQNRIGALVTVRNRPDVTNVVSAVDGFFRLGEAHSLNTMLINSTSTKDGGKGFAGFAQYYYSTNQWKVWWTQTLVTKNFNPDMGFVSRSDVIGATPGVIWYYRGKHLPIKKYLRAWEPSISPELYYQASTGKLVERTIPIYPLWLNMQSGAYLGYGIIPTYQRLTETFEPLGVYISAGEYNYTRHQIWASTDPSRKINAQLIFTGGNYFNGRLGSTELTVQVAPDPHFSVKTMLNRNKFTKVGTPQTSATIDLYNIEARIAFNPRLQLIGFYQRNSQNDEYNYNIRFSWEYQPLSYIYIVFNRSGFQTVQGKPSAETHFIGKISYLRQL